MFHRLLHLLFTMSLLSLLGCSPPSNEMPASLEKLRVDITIDDLTERGHGSAPYARKSITAVLRHAGSGAIERNDVQLEVNGVPLEFRVSTGNYYDRHPYYRLGEDAPLRVNPDTEYHFVLVLPDGVRHPIGTIRTPAAVELSQIDFPSRRPNAPDVTLRWRELKEPAGVALFRTDTRIESNGTQVIESGSVNDPAALRRKIGPGWFRSGTGEWKIPTSFLANSDARTLMTLGAEIRAAHENPAAKTFAKGSTLRAERRLTLYMEFVEQK